MGKAIPGHVQQTGGNDERTQDKEAAHGIVESIMKSKPRAEGIQFGLEGERPSEAFEAVISESWPCPAGEHDSVHPWAKAMEGEGA